jgi:hypothetical protein
MGMSAETAIVDYRLSFANRGKQFPFSVSSNGSLPFSFSVCSIQTEVAIFHDICFPTDAAVSDGKWKTEAQVVFFNLFTFCSLCKWRFVVCIAGH